MRTHVNIANNRKLIPIVHNYAFFYNLSAMGIDPTIARLSNPIRLRREWSRTLLSLPLSLRPFVSTC